MGEVVHVDLGGSTAHRWMACPGSVRLSAGIPKTSTWYADEGTTGHALMELCLQEECSPFSFVGFELAGREVTFEMADNLAAAVGYCSQLQLADYFWTEKKLSLEPLDPPTPMLGYADVVAYDSRTKTLHVVDLKYGKGVVDVKNNPQLRYYAVGAMVAPDMPESPETIVTTIIQPRTAHRDGKIRSDSFGIADLRLFADKLIDAATKTTKPDAPVVKGKHCRYCPAKPICPAHA